jgi:hypothetical protein
MSGSMVEKINYAMNNIVVVDHHGLFIHDVNCLWQSKLYKWWRYYFVYTNESKLYKWWRYYFVYTNECFEYLLGDRGYLGEDKFMMRQIWIHKLPLDADLPAVEANNKKHAREYNIVF